MQAVAGFLSVTESAEELGMARQNVWKQIKTGTLKAIRVGEMYVIPKTEVHRFRKQSISKLEDRLESLRKKERTAK